MDRVIAVHPNSMAARKWKRTTWTKTRSLYVMAHEAHVAGDTARAAALRRAAARAGATEAYCR